MSEELWYVKLGNGDVHRVTLDQLDGAFQAGHIDGSTMVLAAGADTWSKLGDLAGLDGEPEEVATNAATAAASAAQGAARHQPATYAPATVAAAALAVATPAQAPAVQAQSVIDSRSSAPRAAPAAAYAPRAVSISPPAAMPAYAASSLRPMSMDLSADDLDTPFRRSASKRWLVAVLGVAAIAGGVAFAVKQGRLDFGMSRSDLSSAAAAAAMAPPPVDPISPSRPSVAAPVAPAAAALPSTTAQAAGEGSPLNPQFTTRFNEDTKQKLMAADKTRDQRTKSRHAAPSAGNSSRSKSTSFTTGGNKFDPLNSSI